MPSMSKLEQVVCRSAAWRWLAREVILPWALQREVLTGEVLELGSGSGAMAQGILERFPDVRLTATDYDPAMVDAARRRLAGFGERARVERADATALGYPAASFDAVVSFIMLHHVLAWEDAIAEALRVLRPGGVLVGYDLLAHPVARAAHVIDRSRHRLVSLRELRTLADRSGCAATLEPGFGRLLVRFRFHVSDRNGAGLSRLRAAAARS